MLRKSVNSVWGTTVKSLQREGRVVREEDWEEMQALILQLGCVYACVCVCMCVCVTLCVCVCVCVCAIWFLFQNSSKDENFEQTSSHTQSIHEGSPQCGFSEVSTEHTKTALPTFR